MDFWSSFKQECLHDPYVIKPLNITEPKVTLDWPTTDYVFVFEMGSLESLKEMAEKMKLAIKLSDKKLTMIELDGEAFERIENSSVQQKILFFGPHFPGVLGEWIHWQGHEVIKTHSLIVLDKNPHLKRETWQHLKLFVGSV